VRTSTLPALCPRSFRLKAMLIGLSSLCLCVSVVLLSSAQEMEPIVTDPELDPVAINASIGGRVVDRTHNHGCDKRMWSRSLYQWRDLYVYLPPGFDGAQAYPVILYLHGFGQDERSFLRGVRAIDAAILRGTLPPVIVAAPDGSLDGCGCLDKPGSWFINSGAGPFEDYVLQDVWDHLTRHYPIRPEREAHALVGVSMGGFAAFNLGMRHRYAFAHAAAILPPLNVRWADTNGDPQADFNPTCWGWRQNFASPLEIVGRVGPFPVRMKNLLFPLFGDGEEALQEISANNPIELIDRTGLRNGELGMFIGYAGCDEFNLDAQVESFLYYAKCRGLGVHVAYDPKGHHSWRSANRFLPPMFRWLGARLAPYAAPLATATSPVTVPLAETQSTSIVEEPR
jgi:S-formylglutathione hydrolase FrmB